jgi:hypothetical protein
MLQRLPNKRTTPGDNLIVVEFALEVGRVVEARFLERVVEDGIVAGHLRAPKLAEFLAVAISICRFGDGAIGGAEAAERGEVTPPAFQTGLGEPGYIDRRAAILRRRPV